MEEPIRTPLPLPHRGDRIQDACIKRASGWTEPYGVCTISSDSNAVRQDWIACPYRTLDQHFTLLASAVQSAYDVPQTTRVLLLPLTVLHRPDQRKRILAAFQTGVRVFLFSSQKLGGEIDLPETEASPGAAVDMSVIEVTDADGHGKPSDFGNHLFYEIQTADFHGSPLHAAALLRDACPQGARRKGFYGKLKSLIEVCGTGVEGPNKANIFKRTIYQMIFKIELARAPECSGFAIVGSSGSRCNVGWTSAHQRLARLRHSRRTKVHPTFLVSHPAPEEPDCPTRPRLGELAASLGATAACTSRG